MSRPLSILLEYSLLLTLFFLPFSKSLAEITSTTAIIAWLLLKILHRDFNWTKPEKYCYPAFLVLTVVSTMLGPEQFHTVMWRGVGKWLQYMMLFFVCADFYRDAGKRDLAIKTFLMTVLLVSVNGYIQLANGVDLIKGYSAYLPGRSFRMSSSLQSPNDLAAFYMIALPLATAVYYRNKARILPRIGLAAIMILMGTGLLLTMSRSGFLAIFITFVMFCLLLGYKKKLLVFAAALGLLLFFSETLRYNFIESINFSDATIAERLRYWSKAWHLAEAHPLFGRGINTFHAIFQSVNARGDIYRGYAHNSYLQMLVEMGWVGLFCFAYPFIRRLLIDWFGEFEHSGDSDLVPHALMVGLTAFLVQAGADTHFYGLQTSILVWYFWGMYRTLH